VYSGSRASSRNTAAAKATSATTGQQTFADGHWYAKPSAGHRLLTE